MRDDTSRARSRVIENDRLAGFPDRYYIIFKMPSHLPAASCYLPIVLFVKSTAADAARIKNAASRAGANKETCSADEYGLGVS